MSNQISWQSAFWALVPIALNSMCQPCGKVIGLPSKYGFYLNSSPVVCAANALELVSKIVWRSCSIRSVEAAASLTANEIFEDAENLGGHDGLAQLQEILPVRIIVFAGGAITQVIKLYAVNGIPGTKFCACLYLGSFFTIEPIMIWLKCYRSSSQWQNNHGSCFGLCKFLRTIAFFITISYSSVAFVESILKSVTGSDISYANIVFVWTFMGLLSLLWDYFSSPERPVLAELHSKFYHLLRVTIAGGLLYARPDKSASIWDLEVPLMNLFRDSDQAPSTLHPLYYLLASIFFFATHLLGSRRAFQTGPEIHQYCASIAFMLLHILAAILSYAFDYDPQGTYKPSWTKVFG